MQTANVNLRTVTDLYACRVNDKNITIVIGVNCAVNLRHTTAGVNIV